MMSTADMIKRITNTLSLILLIVLASCKQEDTVYQNKIMAANDATRSDKNAALADTLGNAATAAWPSPKAMTPFSFLETMKKASGNALGVFTMTDDFSDGWIRKEDIVGLMKLIDSQGKCSCFVNPLSSRIPKGNATIGGYAIAFVNSYKEKRKVSFGLHACPETDKQKVDVLRKWWTAQEK